CWPRWRQDGSSIGDKRCLAGRTPKGPDRSGAAKLNESLLVCQSSAERGIPEPIHVWQVCRATSARSATFERHKFLFAHSLRRLGLEAYHKPGTSHHSKRRTNVRLRPYHYKHRTDADQSCRIPHSHLPKGDAPDFVEVGEAGIAMDDAMRRQRRVQLVG